MNGLDDFIHRQEESVSFGTLQVTIKRDNNETTSVTAQKLTSYQVADSEEALTMILTLLKAIRISKDTGELTFTMMLKGGEANRMIVQDIKRLGRGL